MELTDKLLLTVPEVVKLTGYSYGYVRKLIAEGKLPGVVRTGRTVRVSTAVLRQWIADQAKAS